MRTQTHSHELRRFLEIREATRKPARARPLSQAMRPEPRQETKSTGSRPTSAAPAGRATHQAQRAPRLLSVASPIAPKEDSPHLRRQSAIPIQPLPKVRAAFFERSRQSPEAVEPYKWSNFCRLHVARPTRS